MGYGFTPYGVGQYGAALPAAPSTNVSCKPVAVRQREQRVVVRPRC